MTVFSKRVNPLRLEDLSPCLMSATDGLFPNLVAQAISRSWFVQCNCRCRRSYARLSMVPDSLVNERSPFGMGLFHSCSAGPNTSI